MDVFQMTIVMDFDNTFTNDPIGWTQVIKLMQARGHNVICVSACPPSEWCINHRLDRLPPEVTLFCSWGHKKRAFMRILGIECTIWIDDHPDMIIGEEKWWPTNEQLEKEGFQTTATPQNPPYSMHTGVTRHGR